MVCFKSLCIEKFCAMMFLLIGWDGRLSIFEIYINCVCVCFPPPVSSFPSSFYTAMYYIIPTELHNYTLILVTLVFIAFKVC